MRERKIRLGFSIVTDILLINLAFICAYQTCKLLGLNLLELFNLAENDSSPSFWASQSPGGILFIIALTVTAIRLCTFFRLSTVQTGLALRECSGILGDCWRRLFGNYCPHSNSIFC
jgi:hypothetical protein